MSELARKHKVIYVNQRRELREVIGELLREGKLRLGIRKIDGNLLLVESPWLFPKIYKVKCLDGIINWAYHKFVMLLGALMGRGCVKVLYIWEPEFAGVVRYYQNYNYIYHPYDLFEKYTHVVQGRDNGNSKGSSTGQERMLSDEKELVQNALLFYSVSDMLCNHYYNTFGRRPKLLTNAVQDIYFGEGDAHLQKKAFSIVAQFPAKKIACSGSLIGSLDLDMIIDSSKRLQDYVFLFIGPIRKTNIQEYDDKLDRLLSLENVFQLGPFNVEVLPYLLRRMDILVMIYNNDKTIWTHYGGPSKLFEYMAIGKPIISSPHPAVNEYEKYIRIVEDSEQFVSAVREIEMNPKDQLAEEMVQMAKRNTWKEREKMILDDLRNTVRSGLTR